MFMKLVNQSVLFIFSKILKYTIDIKTRFLVRFVLNFRYSTKILKFRSEFFRFVLFLTSEKKLTKLCNLCNFCNLCSFCYIEIKTTGSLSTLDNQLKKFLTNLDLVFVSKSKQ